MSEKSHHPEPRPPIPIGITSGEVDDFDLLTDAAEGWDLDWIQLDRGPLRARFQTTWASSVLASRFEFNRKFHQRGAVPTGMRTFGMIAPASTPIAWRGITGSEHHLVVFPSNDVFEFLSLPGFSGDTLSISEKRLNEVVRCLDGIDSVKGLPNLQSVIESDPAGIRAFRRRLDELHALSGASIGRPPTSSVVADAEFEVIAALLGLLNSGCNHAGRPELCTRSKAFCFALDYIRTHASQAPSIEQICRVSGVSWRTLNYAFRERLNLTPKQYLKAVQLRRVRQDLIASPPEATIAEIAGRWGFWHMGQFAKDYRRQFGELPSETRKRK